MKLSKNLKLSEVTKSQTAIRNGIDNEPKGIHLNNLRLVAHKIFQPVRDYFGVPIYVSSGYRSQELNHVLNGAPTSYHTQGLALDFDQDNRNSEVTNYMIFNFIRERLDYTELIWEFGDDFNPDWVHCAYDVTKLEKQTLKALKVPHPNKPNKLITKYEIFKS